MKKMSKITALLAITGIIFALGQGQLMPQVSAVGVSAPIFDQVVSGSRPYITCHTIAGSEVMVYIDNVFAGMASVTSTVGSTSNYIYYYSSNLNTGKHLVTLASRQRSNMLVSDRSVAREIIIPDLKAPFLSQPTEKTITSNQKVNIEGTTLSGTFVHIYIDGVYNGKTPLLKSNSGIAKIKYAPFLNLGLGWHTAYAIAESAADGQSLVSNTISFNIERPMPAPVVRSASISGGKVRVNGLTKSGSTVRVYVDRKLDGQIKAGVSKSGTSGFFYNGLKTVSAGNHSVHVTALDWRGKESPWSNIVVAGSSYVPTQSVITPVAVKEKKNTVAKIAEKPEVKKTDAIDFDHDGITDYDEINKYHTNPQNKDTDFDGYDDKIEIDHGYSPLISALQKPEQPVATNSAPAVSPEAPTAPAVTTSTQSQNQVQPQTATRTLTLADVLDKGDSSTSASNTATTGSKNNFVMNLVIFLVFLVGIIAWILWVNKELIKEKSKMKNDEKEVKDESNPTVL